MEKIEEIKDDIKKYSAIGAISSTPGGKIVIERIQKDIVSNIDELRSKYKTISHVEMIALCASLSEKLALLRVLNKSKKLKKIAEDELKFLLKEE
jgi:hypothetical protein